MYVMVIYSYLPAVRPPVHFQFSDEDNKLDKIGRFANLKFLLQHLWEL